MTSVTQNSRSVRIHTWLWLLIGAVIFVLMALLGVLMRLVQGGEIVASSQDFYSAMTLHGLGMTGVLYTVALITLAWNLSKEGVRMSPRLLWASFVLVIAGVSGLVVATIFGKFAPGWYMLYPLPFSDPSWSATATGLGFLSVLLLGVAWLVAQLSMLAALIRHYGFFNIFGWQYFFSSKPRVIIPAVVLISSVSLGAGTVAVLSGAVFLVLNLAQWLVPSLSFDALFMKNIVFMFGHTFINVGMYMVVASIYAIMPIYSGRPWPVNRVVALSWNAAFFLVLGAFGHHTYMDFVQPHSLHYIGQIASYLSMIPILVVTVIGVINQVYRSGIRWSVVPSFICAGVVGWVVGGVAAVVDATIVMNAVFHNTLWVPAHFHTYTLNGYMFFLFAFAWHTFGGAAERAGKAALALMVIGGAGIVVPFYIAGWASVPRRYMTYDALGALAPIAKYTSIIGAYAGIIFTIGFILFVVALIFKRRQ